MEDAEIIEQVLYQLDGWVVNDNSTSDLFDEEYNKKINEDEILHFYDVAYNYAISYTQLEDFTGIVISDTALILWTAGLLWRKYNIRTNNQLDEDVPIGFGDSLIIQAKEMLKPYKKYTLYAY